MGTADAWQDVEKKWIANLDLWNIKEFHLAELPKLVGRELAPMCADSFGEILGNSELTGIGAVLNDRDWSALSEEEREFKDRYFACLYMLISVLGEHASLMFPGERVAIFIDRDRKESAIHDLFRNFRGRGYEQLGPVAVSDCGQTRLLQCADLAAGLWRKNWVNDSLLPMSGQFQQAGRLCKRRRGAFWTKRTSEEIAKMRASFAEASEAEEPSA